MFSKFALDQRVIPVILLSTALAEFHVREDENVLEHILGGQLGSNGLVEDQVQNSLKMIQIKILKYEHKEIKSSSYLHVDLYLRKHFTSVFDFFLQGRLGDGVQLRVQGK